MAKKKKKYLIKLNNKIRNYFDGLPFDEGILNEDEDKLIELIMLLEINLPSHSKDEMVRALRRIWSEEGAGVRETIVSYLTQSYKAVHTRYAPDKSNAKPLDRVEKILSFLEDEICSKHEENLILEAFIDVRIAKITPEKVQNKLSYLRMQSRLEGLEEALEVSFTVLNEMEFYHSFSFGLEKIDFNKLLLCRTISLDMDALWHFSDEEVMERLELRREESIAKKTLEVQNFLTHLSQGREHYLSQNEIHSALKAMSPDTLLHHAPLSFSLIERTLSAMNDKYIVFESSEHIIIEKEKHYSLFATELTYISSVSYEKSYLYALLWRGEEPPILDDINRVNDELLAHFKNAIDEVYEEMKEVSAKLTLEEETLHEFIIRFVEPQIRSSMTLKFKEKSRRRILFHFGEYIKPLLDKQKREELLAKTIRDFKNLFPLARQLKRKIIFHVGPTNSGKTYHAMQRLEKATTGYYLAPLRLLALEGYENLQKNGVKASLITGEEEIIDEESTHISSTIEMVNMEVDVDVCVIDEIQMISDRDRGWAWANALMGVPAKTVILTGSPNALIAIQELCEYLEEELEVLYYERKNPLEMMPYATALKDVEPQTAIVAFSRRDVLSLKQQLSQRYEVSVVYGNLSPEVRREEARRFREGKSQVLVSTDAIAMGLNLPIKTLLFAKDNKFDGLRRRELLPTEVSQIAGRAGRFGFEEKGFIGTVEAKALESITSAFHAPLPDITLPVSVMASLEHVMLIGEILETDNILDILAFFADNMEFEGPFVAANIESMLEIASIVTQYHLDLKTRFFLSCAPASISSPYIESVFHRYIKQIEAGSTVLYIPPRDLPPFAQTNDMLLNAEDRVREISLYLWLSFKFPEIFQQSQKAIEARVRLNQFIENSLRQGHFSKECRKCHKALDFTYKFSICDTCHAKNKRGSYQGRESAPRGGYRRNRGRR